jgi:hypothetical protein
MSTNERILIGIIAELEAELGEMTRLRELAVREGDRLVKEFADYRAKSAEAVSALEHVATAALEYLKANP